MFPCGIAGTESKCISGKIRSLSEAIFFSILLIGLTPVLVLAASFDCKKASSNLEKQICSNAEIGSADENLSKYYLKLMKSLDRERAQELRLEQQEWLKQRNVSCPAGDWSCLKKIYNDRVQTLRIRYENLVPFDFVPSGFQGLRGTCSFADVKFPEDYAIYAAGWYAGADLDVQIDQSGHQATRFDVIVNSPDKPVVLMLGAYEPSIWHIGWTGQTVILAAVVTGYHRQAVAGLPKDTPILISTSENGSMCGSAYPDGRNQGEIDSISHKLFGKPSDATYLVGAGKAVLGKPLKTEEQVLTSTDVTIEEITDRKMPLAGPAGLKDLLKKGFLRLATQEDREEWIMRKTRKVYEGKPRQKHDPFCTGILPVRPARVDEFYVILKHFRLPNGLHGGNSADFFLSKGVPFPEGDLASCHLYDFNTMKCHGPVCDRSDCH